MQLTAPEAASPLARRGIEAEVLDGASGDGADLVEPELRIAIDDRFTVAAGDRVKQITIPNAGHFELIDPKSKAFDKVRSVIEQF